MKRFQLFLRGISTNWTGKAGVALTTATFLVFVFFELLQLAGILTNAYIGLISYMALPALFVLGLVLIPIGWWQHCRAQGRSSRECLTERFPGEMIQARGLGSSLFLTIALLTVVNLLFLGVGGGRMVKFMDGPRFCGTACHQVMEPEWVAFQNSPHANVRCVDCHVGEGAGAKFNAKLNGLRQMVSSTFDLYERPVPTPVHQLRPARETCEKCHWPDKFYGDRIKTFTRFAMDEASTRRHTTLALKVGSGSGRHAGTIHWHVAEQNEVRYRAADEKRMVMDWVEVRKGGDFHRYTNRSLQPAALEHPVSPDHDEIRSMDCVDCHNRATHIYQDPEAAVDQALADGAIDGSLPFAKRVALSALINGYPDKDAARAGIDRAVRGFYLRDLERADLATSPLVDGMVSTLQGIYDRNIFPAMNVGWNTYPTHLGHEGDGGCFRCHNRDMVDEAGQAINYDCTLCHSILALDSAMEFQFLLPLEKGDPDLQMHRHLQEEFLGITLEDPYAVEEGGEEALARS